MSLRRGAPPAAGIGRRSPTSRATGNPRPVGQVRFRETPLSVTSFWVAPCVVGVFLAGCGAPSPPSAPGSSGPDGSTPLPTRTAVASPEYASFIDSARALLETAASEGVGVAAAVAVNGELVWVEGAGYADRAIRAPVDPEATRFRIYSVAKPMTAVAAARLMERGRLDPSAPVQRYVPDFPEHPEYSNPLTPMQLATHTSGIRHYADDAEAESQRHCETVEEALAIFRDDPLVHPPGQGETYSSWGYVLLSAVLEGASGSTYPETMESWVFEPVGMSRTVVDDPTRTVPGRATFYEEVAREGDDAGPRARSRGDDDGDDAEARDGAGERGGTRIVPADPVDNTCKWGAGGYLSTAGDVARFGAAMLDPAFLSPPGLELFMRGEDVYRAQGVGAGGAAFLVVDRTSALTVALLSNAIGERSGPAAQETFREILELFEGAR